MSSGMILGKFMPPHFGHLYLAEFAQSFVDELTIVVGTLGREPIPGVLRYEWMRELVPRARVLHLTDENPQDPSETPEFWPIWERSLRSILPLPIDYVFASEAYGARLAEILGARFVPVDAARAAVPVSGTAIRREPLTHWQYLPRSVRPYFAKRVCVFGPESTGKSTLARELAAQFATAWVPEYARTWLEAREGRVSQRDLLVIARGQRASETALLRAANRVLICDTDVHLTRVWSEALFGGCEPELLARTDARPADLYLLTDVDVPWVSDTVRYLPDERESFFARCEAALRELGARYLVIRGSWQERRRTAIAVIEALLGGT